MALAVAPRVEVQKCAQISANARQPSWTRNSDTKAASLRVNMLIGQVNLKHESLRRDQIRQGPSTTPHSMHKPATQQAKPQHARPRAPSVSKIHAPEKPNAWRPTSTAVPEPPTTCGTWPAFDLDPIRCRCRKPCGVDTGHFRAVEPSNR